MRWLPALSFVVIAIVHSERAEAACEIGDFGPTAALPTQRVGQSFGFVATTDCRGLTFLATSVRLSKTPTPGLMLDADRQRYHVELSEAEWRQVSQPRVEQFNWVVYQRGVERGWTLNSNEIDGDQDGWTRTDGDLAACDFDPARNPGVTDVRGNGVDDDCDGGVDNTRFVDPVAQIVAPTYFRPAIGDLDADGIADLAFGRDSGNGDVYVVYGPTHGSLSALDFSALVTTTSEYIGRTVAIGDADGDGIDDLATGSLYPLDADELRTYLLLGPVTAERRVADAEAFFDMPDSGSTDVDIVSDFDGDGTADVVVGAVNSGPDGEDVVYVGSGGSSGTVALETSATYTFVGNLGLNQAGIGDVTGDGIADLALSGNTVYLMEGGTPVGSYDVASAAWATLTGVGGLGVASGDYDGDGALDIITGNPNVDNGDLDDAGAAYAFLGPLSGATSADDAVATWTGREDRDYAGEDVAAGDVDGDGSLDVLIGAPEAEGGWGGVYLQLGFASGSASVSSLPTFSPGTALSAWGEAGAYVHAIPDWEGDGGAEVAISSGHGGAAVVYESSGLF